MSVNLSSSLPVHLPEVIIDIISSYYDFFKGNLNVSLIGHIKPITCIDVISPDYIVSGSFDKTVRIWNTKTVKLAGKCELILDCKDVVTCVAFFSGNIASQEIRYVISGSIYGEMIIWNINTGKSIRILKGHTESIKSIGFIHSSNTMRENKIISCSADGTIRIWNFESDCCEYKSYINQYYSNLIDVDLRKWSNNLILYQDVNDKHLRIISYDMRGVYVWYCYDINSTFIRYLNLNLIRPKVIGILSKTSRPKIVILSNYSLYIYDLITMTFLCKYKEMNECDFSNGVKCATIISNDLIAIGTYDKTLVLWDCSKKSITIGTHPENIHSIFVLSEKHETIASRSKDGTLKIWNVSMNELEQNNSNKCIQTFTKNKFMKDTSNFFLLGDNKLVTYYNQLEKEHNNEINIWN